MNTLFVPENPRPGHLHATLSGFVETGLLAGDGRAKSATQVRLSGEVGPGVRLEAHALDGETSVLGSQLGLSGRDAWHVGLAAAGWSATVGETRAPSLGFVAPGAFGRGFTGGLRRDSWSADGFALRDSLGGSVRETAGFRVAGPGASWEAGAMLQRNREFSFVREERAGAFAGLHWAWSGIKGHTQLAVAGSGGSGVNPGFAQTVDYQGERARINAQFERAERGFFLQDQKSERRSLHGEWSAGGGWVLLSEFDRSEQAGRLRTLLRERDSLGQSDDPVEVIELINEVATRQESLAAGFRRDFTPGSFKAVFRRQERVGELVTARTFVEDAIDAEWTRRASDPWWRLGATLGREKGGGESARFAEIRGSAQWSPTRWSHLDGSVRWTSALSGDPRGFRRAGIHGQINATASLARGWNAGLRVEGYDFDGFESRTRLGAVLRFPLGRQGWSGAVEWGRDTRTGDETAWLVLRAPLSIGMPWRPVRGTVGGRVVDAATGAGLPHVLVRSGAQVAVSDETGRYQLPAMEPGMNPITVQAPSGWTEPASSSRAVTVVAGRRDSLDIALVELGTLRGEIRILDASGSATAVPAGVVVAEGNSGSVHETLAYRGLFTMRLPPGTYRLKFVSGLPDSVGRQLDTGATVGGADPVTVRMEARTEARRIRRTLTSEKRDSTDPGRG